MSNLRVRLLVSFPEMNPSEQSTYAFFLAGTGRLLLLLPRLFHFDTYHVRLLPIVSAVRRRSLDNSECRVFFRLASLSRSLSQALVPAALLILALVLCEYLRRSQSRNSWPSRTYLTT